MRKMFLTAVMACLVTVPVLAQFGGFGFGGSLLSNADVQKELKLTDEQKKAITDADTKFRETLKEEGFEGLKAANETKTKAIDKVRDGLKAEQKARLLGIEVQQAEKSNQLAIFQREEVVKALKLTDKQKDLVKESIEGVDKDRKEIFEDAKGDRSKFREAMTKVQGLSKEAFAKITKELTEDQKASWKKLQGEKFDLKMPTFPGGKGKGKDKTDF